MGRFDYVRRAEFSELKGKTLVKVTGLERGSETATFECSDGSVYQMTYYHDCCANCSVEDVDGLENLEGATVFSAEESSNSEDPALEEYPDSYTWTYYKLATSKGYVTIRWYGSSNGYYSESCTFERVK